MKGRSYGRRLRTADEPGLPRVSRIRPLTSSIGADPTPDWSRIDLHAIERATAAQARRGTKGIDDIVAYCAAHNHDDTHRDVLGPQLREDGPSGSRIITAPHRREGRLTCTSL
jgi:hypothetical protein